MKVDVLLTTVVLNGVETVGAPVPTASGIEKV